MHHHHHHRHHHPRNKVVGAVLVVLLWDLIIIVMLLPIKSSAWSLSPKANQHVKKIAVIGGGASGMFAAIAAGEEWLRARRQQQQQQHQENTQPPLVSIHVLEATRTTLTKVKNSGGGRCNVLHDTTKTIPDLLAGYPRGKRELQGIFHKRFTPHDAQSWFEQHGVTLKTEPDGRMFPTTDSSQTIIDSLLRAADQTGIVHIDTKRIVKDLQLQQRSNQQLQSNENENIDNSNGWIVSSTSSSLSETIQHEVYDAVILATGSSPTGYRLAANVGLEITSPVPSLFTLSTQDMVKPGGLFHGLSGVSVPFARISLELPTTPPTTLSSTASSSSDAKTPRKSGRSKSIQLEQEGPILITHQGLSGPAALRLSAFAARDLHDVNYRATLHVHWAPTVADTPAELFQRLSTQVKTQRPKKFVTTLCPWPQANIPKRLWSALVQAAGISDTTTWSQVSHGALHELARYLAACPIDMTGKSRFADEFVTAGGLTLKQVDMTTMQTKLPQPGLFVCGEILDVDGITGGYNFMNCWSTGYVAGCAALQYVMEPATKVVPVSTTTTTTKAASL